MRRSWMTSRRKRRTKFGKAKPKVRLLMLKLLSPAYLIG
tara:strand:+ start:214 stop:330 length:117 start_codon:yes stop_codon:yes gene_type:complete